MGVVSGSGHKSGCSIREQRVDIKVGVVSGSGHKSGCSIREWT